MKKRRNGFTLVELLAVIVILGIILVIAVPGVLGIINKAKKDAWVNSAAVLVDTMKMDHQANGVKEKTEYSFKNNKIIRKATKTVPEGTVPFDGKFEETGEVTIDEKGKVTAAFENDKWCASKTVKDTKLQVKDGKCDLSIFDTTPPIVKQFVSTKQTSNSITVSMSCEDPETSIVGYEFSKDGGTNYTAKVEDSIYTFDKLKSGTYQLRGKCINKAGLSSESEIIEKSTVEVDMPTYTVNPSGDVWATKKTVTITYPTREANYVYEYSIDGGTSWITVDTGTTKEIEFTSNGTVIARIYDGTNYKTASAYSVGKVDSTAPTGVSVGIGTKTSNSIQVTANGSDPESGITKYEFSIDGKAYVSNGTNKTYTFTGVTSGDHTVKVRLTNGAGLTTESAEVSVNPTEITLPVYSVTPSGDVWAAKKTVTITYPTRETGFIYEYSLNGGTSWNTLTSGTSVGIDFTSPGTVIARIYDGTNYKTASAYSVGKVDSTAPTGVGVGIGTKTTNSIQVTANGSDPESGIIKYEFSIDGGAYINNGTTNAYTFNKVTSGSHTIKIRLTNGSGLTTEASTTTSVSEITAPTYSINPSGDVWASKKTVTITYPARETGFVYEYSIDGGTSWITVDSGTTKAVEFTTNGTVIARIYDGTNYKTASAYSVGKVDSTAPTGVSVTIGSRTTNSIQVTANGSDPESGITKYEFSIDGGAYINNGTTKTYTFTKVTAGNHTIKVRLTNGSGLTTESGSTPTAPLELTEPIYTVSPTGDVWAPKKTVTITYPTRETNYVYEYSLNGGTSWTTVTSGTSVSIDFTSPGNIIARIYDGTNYKTASAYSVGKVDGTAPTGVSVGIGTKTTNSIQVTANGSDPESGIIKYEFSIDGGTYINNGTSNVYTFTKVTTGNHTVKVRLTNGSGLTTEASTTTSVSEITTPTYSISPSGDVWAPKKTVTITYPARQTGFVYQYSTNGGSSWNTVASGTTKAVDFTSNGTVIARIYDGTNYKTASAYSVGKVDGTAPTGVSVGIGTKTTNSIQVTANGSDSETGITKYEFSIDGKAYVNNGTSKTYTFTGVTSGNHTIKIRLTNGVGLTTEASTTTAPAEITAPTYSVSPSGDVWATKKTVTITYPVRQTGFVYQYSTNGGSSWNTVSSGTTQTVDFTSSGTVIARIYDGTNYKTASTYTVTRVGVIDPVCFTFNASTNTITGYSDSCPKEVLIPSSIGGVPVKTIGNYAFSGKQLTIVEIPNSVTRLDHAAFGSNELTSVTIPNSVTLIDGYAFGNNKLTSVVIPNSVTKIGDQAFAYNKLTSLTIPKSVTSIGLGAFNDNQLPDDQAFIYKRNSDGSEDKTTTIGYGGAKRSGVVIPNGVTTIGDDTFKDCQLTSVVIPNSVTRIGYDAFWSNQLTSVTIPDSVTSIGSEAFVANKLTSVTIPKGVTSIGKRTFDSNQLTSVTFSNGLTDIGDYAFINNQLTSVTIPNSVTNIGEQAFANNQLTSVTIPTSVTRIYSQVFNNNQLPDSQAFIYNRNSDGSEDKTKIVSYGGAKRSGVVIPNGVITIGHDAFSRCDLTSVTIPSSVTTIEGDAFSQDPLTSIIIKGKTSLSDFTELGFWWYDGRPTITFEP